MWLQSWKDGGKAKHLTSGLVSCSCKIENEEDSMMDLLYTLTVIAWAWLNDNVIAASQEIVAQQFPHIEGLQPTTTLQQIQGFKCHGGEFAIATGVSWPGHINVI